MDRIRTKKVISQLDHELKRRLKTNEINEKGGNYAK